MPAIKKCRLCASNKLETYLDLGFTPLADRFLNLHQLDEPESYYPLKVILCKDCGLSQLTHTVDPRVLYQEEYAYDSSLTKTGNNHYFSFAESVSKKLDLEPNDLVIDVGSNIGTLLEGFKKLGIKHLGIDPATNIVRMANERGIETLPEFFTPKIASRVKEKYGFAKLISATNVFAHIYDHEEFMDALKILLDPKGTFIFESPHFLNLMKDGEYDTIYHEHLLYLGIKPVINYVKKFNMEVFDVEEHPIHGGSIRVFIGYKDAHDVKITVKDLLKKEEEAQIYSIDSLHKFASDVHTHRYELVHLIKDLKKEGKSIAVLSTPAKGMTLLNYCKLGKEYIDFATERSSLKIGKYTPGTHIPIYDDSELLKRRPDYALVLAWNFAPEIIKNQEEYRKLGGKFIIPIPKPLIV